MLDLYRALYPVAASAVLSGSTKRSACFSNDCLWISEQIVRMASHTLLPTSTGNRLRECGEIFKLLSDSWFDDALVRILLILHSSVYLTFVSSVCKKGKSLIHLTRRKASSVLLTRTDSMSVKMLSTQYCRTFGVWHSNAK